MSADLGRPAALGTRMALALDLLLAFDANLGIACLEFPFKNPTVPTF